MKFMRKLVYCLAGLICSFSSIAAVPAMPENLQPAWLFGAVRLTWDPVPEAPGYNVYSYDTNNAIWVQKAANLDVPRYHESYVDVPTIYSVTAVNADGESPPAGPVLAEQTGDWFAISADQRTWTIYDTVAIIEWTVDISDGADGTLEVGTSPTNLTSFAWDTNYATLHRLTVTNLVPGTYYVGRITSVA